jgi:hypothetical protein
MPRKNKQTLRRLLQWEESLTCRSRSSRACRSCLQTGRRRESFSRRLAGVYSLEIRVPGRMHR